MTETAQPPQPPVITSLLNRVDGSAQLIEAGTKVIVSVTGPIEPKLRQELPTQSALEIIVRPAVGVSSTREKLIEDKLCSLLQNVVAKFQHPRQLIQVVVQFLVTKPNPDLHTNLQLSAAANACFYALVDANVPLLCSFAAVPLSVHNTSILVNPESNIVTEADSNHVVCYGLHDASADKILLVESEGSFTSKELFAVLDKAKEECERVHQQQRQFLEQKAERDFVWRK